ncbi:four-carbon acid sugar kinase family protein [Roseomonas sp. WA12]
MRLGCIAVDPAAALELGAALATGGVRAALLPVGWIGAMPEAEAVIALLGPGAPVSDALAACDALLAAGATRILLLTDAACADPATGPIADALLRRLQAGFAPVMPAYPSRGRSVYLGHLFTAGTLAVEEPNLPRRLSARAEAPVGLIPFSIVDGGAGEIRREMSRLAEAGRRLAVLDAVTDAHLIASVEASSAQALLVGVAGLGPGLATTLHAGEPAAEPVPTPRGSWVVLAAASARPTLAQIGFARLHGPVLDLSTSGDLAGAMDRALPLLSEEHPLVISASPALVAQAPAALGGLARDVLARVAGRLLVAGEELFGPVLDAVGCVLRPGPEIAAAVCWCDVAGTAGQIAFKPGLAGGRDILLRAFLTEA